MATPMQLAELRVISEVFNLSIEEVCIEVLKLIDRNFLCLGAGLRGASEGTGEVVRLSSRRCLAHLNRPQTRSRSRPHRGFFC